MPEKSSPERCNAFAKRSSSSMMMADAISQQPNAFRFDKGNRLGRFFWESKVFLDQPNHIRGDFFGSLP